jgi:CDP-diacylglycerol--serine O-phosphatidyltransferase
MKNVRALKHLPNIITLLNMLLGLLVLVIHMARPSESHRIASCGLILIAALLDGMDGRLARRLGAESPLGKQLDSFADLVSFGLAPIAILLTYPASRNGGWPLYICLILYAAAGAFRLARFNVDTYKNYFVGLPITAAGVMMVGLSLFLHYSSVLQHDITVVLIAAFVCTLAVLMVSGFKIRRLGEKKVEAPSAGA